MRGFVKYISAQERAWHKHRKGARRRRRKERELEKSAVAAERQTEVMERKIAEGREMLGVGRKIILLSDRKLIETVNHNAMPDLCVPRGAGPQAKPSGGLRKTQTQEEREVK